MSALLVQGTAALIIVAALVYAQRRLRHGAGPGRAAALLVLERRALGRDTGLAVVSWQGRELLVGFGAAGVTTLLTDVAAAEEGTP